MENVPPDVPDYNVVIHTNKILTSEHRGRYNAPSTSEVTVVIAGQQFDKRDIVPWTRNENLHKISELHRSYDSLQCPLMFCRGEDRYSIDIPQVNPVTREPVQKKVSCMNYYCYRIMERHNNYKVLLRYGMLFNQYVLKLNQNSWLLNVAIKQNYELKVMFIYRMLCIQMNTVMILDNW